MTAAAFLQGCTLFALAVLSLAFLLTVWRIWVGPTLADRVLALDMLVAVGICFIAAIGLRTGFTVVVDIAIALSLVGFLATVALARFILVRGEGEPRDRPSGVAAPAREAA